MQDSFCLECLEQLCRISFLRKSLHVSGCSKEGKHHFMFFCRSVLCYVWDHKINLHYTFAESRSIDVGSCKDSVCVEEMLGRTRKVVVVTVDLEVRNRIYQQNVVQLITSYNVLILQRLLQNFPSLFYPGEHTASQPHIVAHIQYHVRCRVNTTARLFWQNKLEAPWLGG